MPSFITDAVRSLNDNDGQIPAFGPFIDEPGADEAFNLINEKTYKFGEHTVFVSSIEPGKGIVVKINDEEFKIPVLQSLMIPVLINQIYLNYSKIIDLEPTSRADEAISKIRTELDKFKIVEA